MWTFRAMNTEIAVAAPGLDEVGQDQLGGMRATLEPAAQIGLAVLERQEGHAAVLAGRRLDRALRIAIDGVLGEPVAFSSILASVAPPPGAEGDGDPRKLRELVAFELEEALWNKPPATR